MQILWSSEEMQVLNLRLYVKKIVIKSKFLVEPVTE